MLNQDKDKINNKGFTILEAAIALGIVVMGLFGVVALLTQNLQTQSINRDSIVASLLAQEGLELVRNARDTRALAFGHDCCD